MKNPESFSTYRHRHNAKWQPPLAPEGPPPTRADYALFAWLIVMIPSLTGTLLGIHEIAIVVFGLCAGVGVVALVLQLFGIVR